MCSPFFEIDVVGAALHVPWRRKPGAKKGEGLRLVAQSVRGLIQSLPPFPRPGGLPGGAPVGVSSQAAVFFHPLPFEEGQQAPSPNAPRILSACELEVLSHLPMGGARKTLLRPSLLVPVTVTDTPA